LLNLSLALVSPLVNFPGVSVIVGLRSVDLHAALLLPVSGR
jgi:hypothetical protein